jgi:hypothetical protein
MTLRKQSSRSPAFGEILPNLYFRESGNFKDLQRLFFGFALAPAAFSRRRFIMIVGGMDVVNL